MNFSYGIIAAVGVLVAISLVLISISPNDVIEPRETSQKPIICSMDYAPVCGVDGETYGNFCVLEASDVRLDYGGACVDSSSEVEMESPSAPLAVVSLAEGSGIPGCETTNECYLPYEITVSPGTTVTWNNDDSAAHTVTSGNPSDGYDELFDSSIFMTGTSFEFTFDEVGTYDYFCMVHPWMLGVVNVFDSQMMETKTEVEMETKTEVEMETKTEVEMETKTEVEMETKTEVEMETKTEVEMETKTEVEMETKTEVEMETKTEVEMETKTEVEMETKTEVEMETETEVEMETETEVEMETETEVEMTSPTITTTTIEVAKGSGVAGCETTNECYLPYEITVSPGTTVTWNNDDSAAHTVTSGSIDAGLTGVFDSSIFMTGTSFEFTFDEVGTYDYFCMVHPWMTGIVNVI